MTFQCKVQHLNDLKMRPENRVYDSVQCIMGYRWNPLILSWTLLYAKDLPYKLWGELCLGGSASFDLEVTFIRPSHSQIFVLSPSAWVLAANLVNIFVFRTRGGGFWVGMCLGRTIK